MMAYLPMVPVVLAGLVLAWLVVTNVRTNIITNGPILALAGCFLAYGALALPVTTLLLHVGFGVVALVIAIFVASSIGGGTAKLGAVSVLWIMPTYMTTDLIFVTFIIGCFGAVGAAKIMERSGRGAPATFMFAPVLFCTFYLILEPFLS